MPRQFFVVWSYAQNPTNSLSKREDWEMIGHPAAGSPLQGKRLKRSLELTYMPDTETKLPGTRGTAVMST